MEEVTSSSIYRFSILAEQLKIYVFENAFILVGQIMWMSCSLFKDSKAAELLQFSNCCVCYLCTIVLIFKHYYLFMKHKTSQTTFLSCCCVTDSPDLQISQVLWDWIVYCFDS